MNSNLTVSEWGFAIFNTDLICNNEVFSFLLSRTNSTSTDNYLQKGRKKFFSNGYYVLKPKKNDISKNRCLVTRGRLSHGEKLARCLDSKPSSQWALVIWRDYSSRGSQYKRNLNRLTSRAKPSCLVFNWTGYKFF